MITFERLQLVKEMIAQLVVYQIIYNYFNNCYKRIARDLSKQQALDADPKAIQKINFTANPNREGNTTMFFITKEAKETILDFSQELLKYCECVPQFYLNFLNIISI